MRYTIYFILATALLSTACSRRNAAKERVQAQRDAWEASLPDSLEAVKRQSDSIHSEIRMLTSQVEHMLPAFDYVDNPREVEGYYIAKAWAPSYPLKTTGLIARLTKGETLELIAALSGGAHFDRIRVETGGEQAETSRVPHDQALNYRMAGLNTVCFSDSAANACARLIAAASGSQVKITYLNGDRQTGIYQYPAKQQTVMEATWNLFESRDRMRHDERMIPLLAKKGEIITRKIESISAKKK